MLDSMDLERDATSRSGVGGDDALPARAHYMLNLIDTPGHGIFTTKIRAAGRLRGDPGGRCHAGRAGPDSGQRVPGGAEQCRILRAINKIDLPAAQADVVGDGSSMCWHPQNECFRISGKAASASPSF
jgi:translation elongation factor EF-4